jgi:ribosomal protein S18 acetylase RimI-like enzyme
MGLASRPPKFESERVQVRLRDYHPNDFEAIWRLDQLCFDEETAYSKVELNHYLGLKTAFTLIAEADVQSGGEPATLCGFIVAHRRRGGFGHIITIDVDPSLRQHGIGTKLLKAAQDRLAREGCHTIYLETAVNNVAAIAFYKRHDYTVVRTIPRYYHASGLDAFLMSAKLSPADPS